MQVITHGENNDASGLCICLFKFTEIMQFHNNLTLKFTHFYAPNYTYLSAFFATFDINLDVDATLSSLLRLSSEPSQALWGFSAVKDLFMLEEKKIYFSMTS